jgi:hypothetical protein
MSLLSQIISSHLTPASGAPNDDEHGDDHVQIEMQEENDSDSESDADEPESGPTGKGGSTAEGRAKGAVNRAGFADISDAAKKRLEEAKSRLDVWLREKGPEGGSLGRHEVIPPNVHLVDATWRAFRQHVLKLGCKAHRRMLSDAEKREHKLNKKGASYSVEVSFKHNAWKLDENGEIVKKPKVKKPRRNNRQQPMSAYRCFTVSIHDQVKAKYPNLNFGDKGKKMGQMWKALSPEERQKFEDESKALKDKDMDEWERSDDFRRKKAPSAYNLFTTDVHEEVKAANPGKSFGGLGRVIGDRWKKLPEATKAMYAEKCEKAKNDLKEQYYQDDISKGLDPNQRKRRYKTKPKKNPEIIVAEEAEQPAPKKAKNARKEETLMTVVGGSAINLTLPPNEQEQEIAIVVDPAVPTHADSVNVHPRLKKGKYNPKPSAEIS